MVRLVLNALRLLWIEQHVSQSKRRSEASDADLSSVIQVLERAIVASARDDEIARRIPPGISRVATDSWSLDSDLTVAIVEIDQALRRA